MSVQIRPVAASGLAAVAQFALLAWVPVFASFRQVLEPESSPLGPFSRSWQRLMLDRMYDGECDTTY
ncbi:MAG: hypothetical protein ACTHMJ_14275 [Thermomicrobiales bacterium]|jgi:hypothetical protein|nr:hypothetical protein [Thermomicrobiales bacterium]